jgi:site-specific recombinase, phage integrase family
LRFNQIRRILPDVSQRTLTAQLRALEADGIILRTVYPEVPPRVEYRLTDYGKTLAPVLTALKEWGDGFKQEQARRE